MDGYWPSSIYFLNASGVGDTIFHLANSSHDQQTL
jgi:hypothetical protein